jgi:replicative DNA helicase
MNQNSQNRKRQQPDSEFRQLIEFGKVPPQAIELEEAVLGACMMEPVYNEIGHLLSGDCFYKDAHQRIFRAIETLAAENKPVDILTVSSHLKQTGELETIGGPYYITTLTSRVASAANIQFHSMIVYQKFIQRQLINHASQLMQVSFADNFDEVQASYNMMTDVMDNMFAGKRTDRSIFEILKDHLKEVDRRIKLSESGEMTGVKTGIVQLNRMTNGWKPGELIIVAGRPGMGKTAVALNLFTKQAAMAGKRTLFFSLEMDELSLADRLICSYGGIEPDLLKSGKNADQWLGKYNESLQQLQRLPIFIDDTAHADLKHISTISRAKRKNGQCDMIVIDYLQLIEINSPAFNKNREREVAELSRGLKQLARELKIPVLLLCQLNRGVESRSGDDKKPRLGDLRESGAIEQDADMVIFPFRPEYYGLQEDADGKSLEGIMIMIIAKNRNGRTGEVYAKYSPDLTRFFDYDARGEAAEAATVNFYEKDPF